MIEVIIDSIRVSLMSQARIVMLKDINDERYLPIWIGPFEAEAITNELNGQQPKRPLTHDLLNAAIGELGGKVVHILINDLRDDVYYARLVISLSDKQIEVDARPSDAINVAVRAGAPIFVADTVMTKASIQPDEDVEQETERSEVDESKLSAFADFVNSLDFEDLEDSED
jgi:hypothetical protein